MSFSEQQSSTNRTDNLVSLDKSTGKFLVENIELGSYENMSSISILLFVKKDSAFYFNYIKHS